MLLTKRNLSGGDARRAGANQTDVLRNEASPLMIIEGLAFWKRGRRGTRNTLRYLVKRLLTIFDDRIWAD
jgi:hypothetical protein